MKRNYGGLIVGLVFIGIGIGYTGNIVGWWSGFTIFFPGWWSLFIIVPFTVAIAESGFNTGNFIGLLLGLFLLVARQPQFRYLWKLVVPFTLFAIGFSIIFKSKLFKYRRVVKAEDGKAFYIPVYRCWLSSRQIKFGRFELHGAEITTLFGQLVLDLSDAIITKDVVIDVTTIFNGAKIILPPHVKMAPSANPIFGRFIDRASSDPSAVHTVYVNANCIFADTEVKTGDTM